jgi:chromosome partitioning protein
LIRLVIANQRGGVGKTTTAINYACYLAQRKYHTLLIDTDSQGSIAVMLDLKPVHSFGRFLLDKISLSECAVTAFEGLDILCGDRLTVQAESAFAASPSGESVLRQSALKEALEPFESRYDAVVLDVSPSISLLQACALVYARRVLIPVNMDFLSLNGAKAVCETVALLNARLTDPIQVSGFLPCQVHQGFSVTRLAQQGLESISVRFDVPVLPAIRTDQSVNRAFGAREALLRFEPSARAAQDYVSAFDVVTGMLDRPRVLESRV